jgi:hypothetical protein
VFTRTADYLRNRWEPPMSNIFITEREKHLLAVAMHEIWADWMKYVFTVGELRASGEMRLPQWAVARWQRQIRTAYGDLSPSEQQSDLEIAERVIYVLAAATPAKATE